MLSSRDVLWIVAFCAAFAVAALVGKWVGGTEMAVDWEERHGR